MECPNCNEEVWPHFDHVVTENTTKDGRNAIYEDWKAKCPECGGTIWFREWYIHEDDECYGEEESE